MVISMASSPLLACKYTVRDVAFVDLGGESYVLSLRFAADVDEKTRAEVTRRARAILRDTNVELMPTELAADLGPIQIVLEGPAGP